MLVTEMVVYLYQQTTQTNNDMTSITITVPVKAGQQAYFKLIFPKEKFMEIVEMTFTTVQDVINGEKQGLYTIQK